MNINVQQSLNSPDRSSSAGKGAYSSGAQKQPTNIYFPKTDGVSFEQANASQILGEHFEFGSEDVHS